MKAPPIQGVIRRRILVNFRVDPDVIQRLLPAPFRPKLHDGNAIAGICLIRLEHIRPKGFPAFLGISSENAAHRVAVLWDEGGVVREGVYIPRRDTGARLVELAGGRLFPGEHHHARFTVTDSDERIELHMKSDDGATSVHVAGALSTALPDNSCFSTIGEASAFFEPGSLGYSATARGNRLDGITLKTLTWKVEPLAVDYVRSSYFDDPSVFPAGSVRFDCALVMRNIQHEWHAANEMYIDGSA
jgi:hypothetical protein